MSGTAAELDRATKRCLPPIVVTGLLVLLSWCAWRVLSLGLADHFASAAPKTALAWRSMHPEALLAAAESAAASEQDPELAAAFARQALRSNPLPGRGYRILAALEGEPEHAKWLYDIATERSPRDIPSRTWLLGHALQHGDYPAAIRHLDQILRVRPGFLRRLYPILESLAAQREAQPALTAFLEDAPPWRTSFLKVLARRAPETDVVVNLFNQLRQQPRGLTAAELHAWLERLIVDRQWGAAYLAWAGHLPLEQRRAIGNVFNGSFEWTVSNAGFDWRMDRVSGVRIGRAAIDGAMGEKALRIVFGQPSAPFRYVRQLLVLPPGTYRLQGRARLDSVDDMIGLVWILNCAEGGAALASTEPFSGSRPWHAFVVDFVVPPSECDGQWLTLRATARSGLARQTDGVAWFDDIGIVRYSGKLDELAEGLDKHRQKE